MPVERIAPQGKTAVASSGRTTRRAGAAGHIISGAEARRVSEQENQAIDQRIELRGHGLDWNGYNSRRWWRMRDGDYANIIILDKSIDDLAFDYEHHMKDSEGRWSIHEVCPKTQTHCYLCEMEGGKGSEYLMHMSTIDLRGFTKRDDTVVSHYKRPLTISSRMQPLWFKLFDAAMREHKTIRGMQIYLLRDDAALGYQSHCGVPAMRPDGTMFKMLTEKELVKEFGSPEQRSETGALIQAENFDITPYAYSHIFPLPNNDELRRKYGPGGGVPGSQADTQQEWGQSQASHSPAARTRSRTQVEPATTNGGGLAPRTRTRTRTPAVADENIPF